MWFCFEGRVFSIHKSGIQYLRQLPKEWCKNGEDIPPKVAEKGKQKWLRWELVAMNQGSLNQRWSLGWRKSDFKQCWWLRYVLVSSITFWIYLPFWGRFTFTTWLRFFRWIEPPKDYVLRLFQPFAVHTGELEEFKIVVTGGNRSHYLIFTTHSTSKSSWPFHLFGRNVLHDFPEESKIFARLTREAAFFVEPKWTWHENLQELICGSFVVECCQNFQSAT